MEALIHHFKLVTEGFRVPPGQAYTAVESPRGELGAHVVSDGGTRPYRVHLREPSFINLQSTATLSIGGMISDVIASVGSIDPVMGGVRPVMPDYALDPFTNEPTRSDWHAAEMGRSNFRTSVIQLDRPGDPSVFDEKTRAEAAEIIARYPDRTAAQRARSDAAPRAVGAGPGHARRHRVLRRAGRPDQGAGRGVRDLLHDVQAHPDRRIPRQRLHEHAVRHARRRRDLRGAEEGPRASATTRPPPTARSLSSTPSAWPRATTRRSSR